MYTRQPSRESDNQALIREWFHHLQHRNLRPNTYYSYQGIAGALLLFAGQKSVLALSFRDLEAFTRRPRHGRAKGGEGGPSTKAREISVLKSLYAWLLVTGRVERNPLDLVKAPEVPRSLPRPVPDRVWLKLWGSDLPDDAIVALGAGYFLGLRVAEVVVLAPTNVDLAARRLVRFRRKGGGDDVLSYGTLLDVVEDRLPAVTGDGTWRFEQALRRLVEQRGADAALLPWNTVPSTLRQRSRHGLSHGQIDPARFASRLQRWLENAGLPRRSFTPHQLRHAFITNALRCGMPIEMVSAVANHRNIDTTMGYAKIGADEVREWLKSVRTERASSLAHPTAATRDPRGLGGP
jgi:integrase/recombinase XerC